MMFCKSKVWPLVVPLVLSWGATSQPAQCVEKGRMVTKISIATVVPGQRIGKVKLGMSRAVVRKLLGAQSATFELPGNLQSDLWQTTYVPGYRDRPNSLEVVYSRGKVVQIESTTAAFKTAKGVSPATPLHLVREVHPNMILTKLIYRGGDQRRQHYYDDIKSGIAFEYWPDEDEVNTIIVHKAGAKVVFDPGGRLE